MGFISLDGSRFVSFLSFCAICDSIYVVGACPDYIVNADRCSSLIVLCYSCLLTYFQIRLYQQLFIFCGFSPLSWVDVSNICTITVHNPMLPSVIAVFPLASQVIKY